MSSLIYSIQTWSVLEPFSNCGRICIQLGINLIKNTAHSTRKTGNRKMRGTRPETHPGQTRETEGQADSSAQSKDDEFMADWTMRNLVSLADQLDDAEIKMQKEVDTVA